MPNDANKNHELAKSVIPVQTINMNHESFAGLPVKGGMKGKSTQHPQISSGVKQRDHETGWAWTRIVRKRHSEKTTLTDYKIVHTR